MTELAHRARPGRIVVGVDGSPGARRALRWALDEAALRICPLEVVHAWHHLLVRTSVGSVPEVAGPRTSEDAARALLEHEVGTTSVSVDLAAFDGSPARVLVERSADASLVVVGRHGAGGHPLLGNVADQVVHHAACPVAVIPDRAPSGPGGRIVVGVDGSPGAAAAARWAQAEADQRGVVLLAVLAWPLTEALFGPRPADLELPYDDEQARRTLDVALRTALGEAADGVQRHTVGALADAALLEAAAGAAVTVVGARGLGGFVSLLVGSVGRRLIQRAPGPIVVVRSATAA